jgi:hypothetical protein
MADVFKVIPSPFAPKSVASQTQSFGTTGEVPILFLPCAFVKGTLKQKITIIIVKEDFINLFQIIFLFKPGVKSQKRD